MNEETKKGAIINAVKLDAKTPIPLETNGKGYAITKGRKYVPFLNSSDNFFQILLEANLLSPTNLACVNSKTKYSIGKGWYLTDKKEDKDLQAWAKRVNPRGQNLNDILKSVFNNMYTTGNSFINIVITKVGSTKFVNLYVKNFIDCRVKTPDENGDDIPTHVIVSKNFRKKGTWNLADETQFVEVPIYTGDPKQKGFMDKAGNEHFMIHLKNECSGYDYYGMPSNVACLPKQVLEYKMSRFNLDNFDNNLVIGGLIVLQGNLTSDESTKTAREITKAHTGDGERGKYVILSSENGIENSKVINFDQNKEYDFIAGTKSVSDTIYDSNEWSKALINPDAGGLGNSGKQIRELYESKMNTVIGPEQARVIEKVLGPIMEMCKRVQGKNWTEYGFGFENIPVLGITNEIDVNAVLSVNEGREALGYPALEGEAGSVRIKENKQLNLQANV